MLGIQIPAQTIADDVQAYVPNNIMSELVPKFLQEFGKPDSVEVRIVDFKKLTYIRWRCGNNYRFSVTANQAARIADRLGETHDEMSGGGYIEIVGQLRNYEYYQIERAEFMKDNLG